MTSPENIPPGTRLRVGFRVRDELISGSLAQLSPLTRRAMPGSLIVYSERSHLLIIDDEVDGVSQKQLSIDSYKHRLSNHDRITFRSSSGLELRGRFLRLGVELGHQAAHDIVSPPVFDDVLDANIRLPVYYQIPGNGPIDMTKVDEVEEFLQEKIPKAYSDARLMTAEMAKKSLLALLKDHED